jgi:hypothetical protein
MGDDVAILRGVASGERVVKVAVGDVRDGQRVE